MLIGMSLMVMIVISLLSLVIGNNFVSGLTSIGVDNEALVDGVSNTFEVLEQDILFGIDTSVLIVSAIALLTAVILVAVGTGVSFLASGLNPQSSRIIVIITAYIGIWTALSVLAFNLIIEIEIFGSVIYISLTLVYIIGVAKNMSGGND